MLVTFAPRWGPDANGPPCSRGEPRGRYAPSMGPVDASSEIAIEPAQLVEWLAADSNLQLIDVREDYERQAGHIEGSRHIELNQLTAQAATIAADHPVVFYCRLGSRSDMAAQAFRVSGFQAHSMSGGLVRWAQEGRPLEPEGGHVADH
jgi:rhodanese-related sulfurtransferase